MLDHYSHIRMEAKRKALEALSGKGLTRGYDTKDDTSATLLTPPTSQVIEKNGGDDETRTRDLCRDSPANRVAGKGVAQQPLLFVGQ